MDSKDWHEPPEATDQFLPQNLWKELTLPTPLFQTSGLPSHRQEVSVALSYPVYCNFLMAALENSHSALTPMVYQWFPYFTVCQNHLKSL